MAQFIRATHLPDAPHIRASRLA